MWHKILEVNLLRILAGTVINNYRAFLRYDVIIPLHFRYKQAENEFKSLMSSCLDELKLEEAQMGRSDAVFDDISQQHEVSYR